LRSRAQPSQQLAQSHHRLRRRGPAEWRSHEKIQRAELLLLESKRFTDASLDAVAVHGVGGVLARNQYPQPCGSRRSPLKIERVAAEAAFLALAQQMLELRLLAQPALPIEAERLPRRVGDG
jgi:hypothetical protein